MNDLQKRTWAEVDLGNIEHNFKTMKAALRPGTRFLGVVKTNAYGHGALPVAKMLSSRDCDYFAVATIDEAQELRAAGIPQPILILGYTDPKFTPELIAGGITQAVSAPGMAQAMSDAAVAAGGRLKVHLKADSGMGRTGFICHDGDDPRDTMLRVMSLPGLDVEGIFTHFAVSEVMGSDFTARQFGDFTRLISDLERSSGRKFAIRHCANSGAMINYPEMQLDMVRPGIALYGMYPGGGMKDIGLRPAMSLRSRIVQIKKLHSGYSVSYGRTYVAPGDRTIAVIPIGYGDGLHRVLSNRIQVLVNGRRAKQVGNICMDMCMIDVTDIPGVSVGSVVTLFGRDGDEFISADEMAAAAGTISYEIFCDLSPRIPRIYN